MALSAMFARAQEPERGAVEAHELLLLGFLLLAGIFDEVEVPDQGEEQCRDGEGVAEPHKLRRRFHTAIPTSNSSSGRISTER